MCYCTICSKNVYCGNPNCENEICPKCEGIVMGPMDPNMKWTPKYKKETSWKTK